MLMWCFLSSPITLLYVYTEAVCDHIGSSSIFSMASPIAPNAAAYYTEKEAAGI